MADGSRGCSMQGGYAIYHMAVIGYGLDFKICSVQAGTLVGRISTVWDWKTEVFAWDERPLRNLRV